MAYRWASIVGEFEFGAELITFKGGEWTYGSQPLPMIGNAVCDQFFTGGRIDTELTFRNVNDSGCEVIVSYDPATKSFLTAGIGGTGAGDNNPMYGVRYYDGPNQRFIVFDQAGKRSNMVEDEPYLLSVKLVGSRLALCVDGVAVLETTLPLTTRRGQAGIWCVGSRNVEISNYQVLAEIPTAFVVMQFTPRFDELYSEVIRPVCRAAGLEAARSDDTYGPSIVVADIARQIDEARIVIAEITPANPNVFYEVGYAHARNKPTILIAERHTKLPFDVAPFRVLFYENSIAGKSQVEENLRNHIQAIQAGLG